MRVENKAVYFTDDEWEIIIRAVSEGQETFTEDDVLKLKKWIVEREIDHCVCTLIMKGKLAVDTRGKEFSFKKIEEESCK